MIFLKVLLLREGLSWYPTAGKAAKSKVESLGRLAPPKIKKPHSISEAFDKKSEVYWSNQKSSSNENDILSLSEVTPAFWYSPTRFSKKLVFP